MRQPARLSVSVCQYVQCNIRFLTRATLTVKITKTQHFFVLHKQFFSHKLFGFKNSFTGLSLSLLSSRMFPVFVQKYTLLLSTPHRDTEQTSDAKKTQHSSPLLCCLASLPEQWARLLGRCRSYIIYLYKTRYISTVVLRALGSDPC